LHGDVLMWLMKTLLTSGCTNQRGAGQTPEQWAQAGRLIANGMDRKQVAIIYDVAVCTLYKKFPAR
ncbi:helix-turn-helix domain-containing protein, partial [Enterobacter hormaechei]|uniref:helix-turn-helix domain-containing protein n=1 Tax=Enterobacter hormaechei TaxID=158836 RepID=UPI0025510E73